MASLLLHERSFRKQQGRRRNSSFLCRYRLILLFLFFAFAVGMYVAYVYDAVRRVKRLESAADASSGSMTVSPSSPQNNAPRAQQSTIQQLSYWKRPAFKPSISAFSNAKTSEKYVTFEDDTGGWNNIRMAFESFVAIAKITGRTLVLPPSCRFYLLDYGPIKLFKRASSFTWSNYGMFYDLDALRRGGVDVITTVEFLDREAHALGMPSKVESQARIEPQPRAVTNGHHTPYFYWMRIVMIRRYGLPTF